MIHGTKRLAAFDVQDETRMSETAVRIRARIAVVNAQPGSHHGQSKKHEHDGFKQMSQVHEMQRERRLLDPSLLEKIPI